MASHDGKYDVIVLILVIVLVVIAIVMIWRRMKRSPGERQRQRGRSNRNSGRRRSSNWVNAGNGREMAVEARNSHTHNLMRQLPHLAEMANYLGQDSGRLKQKYPVLQRNEVQSRWHDSSSSSSPKSKRRDKRRSSSSSSSSGSSSSSDSSGSSDQNCVKPDPPLIRTQVQGNNIAVTWAPVPGADYYDIYLLDQNGEPVDMEIFFTGNMVVFGPLPQGVYYVVAFSGSNDCGVRRDFSQSGPITIGTPPPPQCTIDTDCPVSQRCAAGTCVAGCTTNVNCPTGQVCTNGTCQAPPPQCTTDIQCPVSQHCVAGSCVAGCTTAINCPVGQVCTNGTCQAPPPQCTTDIQCPLSQHCVSGNCVAGCTTSINCPVGQTCQNGTCQASCPTPVVTGVTLSGDWPGAVQFTFTGTGFPASGAALWTFAWTAKGSSGLTAVSGFLAPAMLPNNKWPTSPASPFPVNNLCTDQPCCAAFNFGCTASGCGGTPSPNVVFEFRNVIVTNDCGMPSLPTCWRFTSMCPGGSKTGVQFNCVTGL